MSKPQVSGHKISVRIADRQLEFLETEPKSLVYLPKQNCSGGI